MNLADLPKTLDDVPPDSELGQAIQKRQARREAAEQAAAEVRRWEAEYHRLKALVAAPLTLETTDAEILAAFVATKRLPLVETRLEQARAEARQADLSRTFAEHGVSRRWEEYQQALKQAAGPDAETLERLQRQALAIVGANS